MADNIIDKMLDMVVRFNSEIIGLPIPGHPQRLQVLRKSWACEALYEEFMEFKNATHMEDEADALIDLTYFALGRLVEMGLAPLPLFESVHALYARPCILYCERSICDFVCKFFGVCVARAGA